MPNLMIKRVDPAAAGEAVRADLADAIPSSAPRIRTFGDPQQPSFRQAMGRELGRSLHTRQAAVLAVVADVTSPRAMRVQVRYLTIGRGAGPSGIMFVARLRHVIPGEVSFRRGRFRNGTFEGDAAMAAALDGTSGLAAATWKLTQPATAYGTMMVTIESGADLVPDPDGALLVVSCMPARGFLNLGGYRIPTTQFLDVATGIERAIVSAPGVRPAPTANAPLPD
jgi:hypothetical protein